RILSYNCGQVGPPWRRGRSPPDCAAVTGAARPANPGYLRCLSAARGAGRRKADAARSSMTLVDTNLLIYATFRDAREHQQARTWLERQLAQSDGGVVLCWPVVYAFVRL